MTSRTRTTCLQCGKPKVMPKQRKVSLVEYERDEFCSRKCCQAYHGIDDAGGAIRRTSS